MNQRRFAPGIPLTEVALAMAACTAATLVYQGFFTSYSYLPVLALACLAGGVGAALGHPRTWASVVSGVTGLALVMIYGVFGGAAPAVFGGMRGSWNRLLTVTTPADTWGELLAAPTLVTWAAAFSSIMLVLRTHSVLAPLLPPLMSFVFALLVVGNQTGAHPAATVVFLVLALVLTALRTRHSAVDATVRVQTRPGAPVTALTAVAATLAASALLGVGGAQVVSLTSEGARFDPRDLLAPPIQNTGTITPLAQLKRQLAASPPRTLFTVRADPESSELLERVRTAALDEFDGTTWTSSGTYRVAGNRLTADPEMDHSRQVAARIELKELPGPYLPVVGWPTRLAAAGQPSGWFGFDAGSGVAVGTGPLPQWLGYDVTGQVVTPGTELWDIPTTPNHSPPLPAGAPAVLRELADRYTGTAYQRLTSLSAYLQGMSYRLNGPPGHSYASLARLFADGASGGGYAEQNAAAFTVLARMWGFPARVAVGYRLRNHSDGVFQVTTADAHAWSEVHFAGYGWVAFDPTLPTSTSTANPPPEAPRVVPPSAAPPTSANIAQPAESTAGELAGDQAFGWTAVLNGTWVLAPVIALLIVVAAAGVVVAKARRRKRRRRAPDHAGQVLGAWQEQMDRLAERGVAPPVSLTFHEVAEHVRDSLGAAANPVEAAAELATRAIYAPDHVGQWEADQAWELLEGLTTGLYPGRVSAARWRAAADPRSLWTAWSTARRRRQAKDDLETGRYR